MRAWEKNIRRVEPYVPGEQPKVDNVIKLNTNENPYPPAPKAYEAAKAFDMDKLRLYPDPECSALVHSIAQYYGMDDNEVFTGVGSDDVLAMCFMTFLTLKSRYYSRIFRIHFTVYGRICTGFRMKHRR